jgi:hypothetical protein
MKKGQTIQEMTMVQPEPEYCEIMVQIICETGKIHKMYCYADSLPVVENPETGKEYKLTTKPGNNPLFVTICSPARIFKHLINHTGTVFITSEGSDEPEVFDRQLEIIEKALKAHDISNEIRVY